MKYPQSTPSRIFFEGPSTNCKELRTQKYSNCLRNLHFIEGNLAKGNTYISHCFLWNSDMCKNNETVKLNISISLRILRSQVCVQYTRVFNFCATSSVCHSRKKTKGMFDVQFRYLIPALVDRIAASAWRTCQKISQAQQSCV